MENETAVQNGTATVTANGANGHAGEEAVEPRQVTSRPAVRYATDEEVERASEIVFRAHHRLLAELAK